VLIHTPGKQDISDFLTIRNMLVGKAPDIRVAVLSVGQHVNSGFVQMIGELPTLIFSPMPVNLPPALRGCRLLAVPMKKIEQIRSLEEAGLPVPRSALLTPDTSISPLEWGELVVMKPNGGERGQGVRLMRASEVRYRNPHSWDKSDPRYGKEQIIQEWINTGPLTSNYRVMTLVGKPIYASKVTLKNEVDYAAIDIPPEGIPIASDSSDYSIHLAYDRDVLDLASSVHKKLAFTSVMGIDLVRQESTGELYVLELNPGGWTWHLSSAYGQQSAIEHALDRYGQFNALNVIADTLVEKTRELAS
jgi:predicted ATP-grasp superfamily ATP-dependent carboligase